MTDFQFEFAVLATRAAIIATALGAAQHSVYGIICGALLLALLTPRPKR
jgi:hypothetical protein